MLESYIIIGLTIAIVEIIKSIKVFQTTIGKLFVPIFVFVIAGGVNALNAYVFGGVLIDAFRDGLTLGAVAGGLYSMGQTYLNKKEGGQDA